MLLTIRNPYIWKSCVFALICSCYILVDEEPEISQSRKYEYDNWGEWHGDTARQITAEPSALSRRLMSLSRHNMHSCIHLQACFSFFFSSSFILLCSAAVSPPKNDPVHCNVSCNNDLNLISDLLEAWQSWYMNWSWEETAPLVPLVRISIRSECYRVFLWIQIQRKHYLGILFLN